MSIPSLLFQAGGGIELEYIIKSDPQPLTSVAADDPWFSAFTRATEKHGLKIATKIFPAATDAVFLRQSGVPALGFSLMNRTPILLHDHNECLNEKVFLKGIDIFVDVISELANL